MSMRVAPRRPAPDRRTRPLLTQVGDNGYNKQRICPGSCNFIGNNPGVVADEGLSAAQPNIKTLMLRSVPKATSHAVTLKPARPTSLLALRPGRRGRQARLAPISRCNQAGLDILDRDSGPVGSKSPGHDKRLGLAACDRYAAVQPDRRLQEGSQKRIGILLKIIDFDNDAEMI